MELEKNGVREYYCLGIHITRAVTALSLLLSTKIHSFLCHISSSIPTFKDMYLRVTVHHIIHVYQIYKK